MNCLCALTRLLQISTARLAMYLLAGAFTVASAQTLAAVLSYPAAFATGWNLAGNSLTTPMDVKTTFGGQASITTVWKWDAAAAKWAFYAPALDAAGTLANYASSKGYSLLTTINQGEGFWVNASAPVSLGTQSGTGLSLAAANLQPSWNLVATADNVSPATLSTTVGNVTTLWAWDNASSSWYFYAPSLAANGTLASYITSKGYKDFAALTLGNGLGFWVNYAGTGAAGMSFLSLVGTPAPNAQLILVLSGLTSTTASSYQITFGGNVSTSANLVSVPAGVLYVTVPATAKTGPITITNLTSNTSVTTPSVTIAATPAAQPTCISTNNLATPLPVSGVVGTNWSDCSRQGTSSTQKVIWDGTQFVSLLTSGGLVQTSLDGYVWSTQPSNISAFKQFGALAFNGSRWVGATTNAMTLEIYYSTGAAPTGWTLVSPTLRNPGTLTNAFAANGHFFIGTNNGSLLVSADGITWTESANQLCGAGYLNTAYTGNLDKIFWDGSKYLMYVSTGAMAPNTPVACTSADGLTWTANTMTFTPATKQVPITPTTFRTVSSSFPVQKAAWSGSKYTTMNGTEIWTSTDGMAWTKEATVSPLSGAAKDVIWAGTQFIAVGYDANYVDAVTIATSSDGVTWTKRTATVPVGQTLNLNSVAYSPILNRAIAVGIFTTSGMIGNAATFVSP